MLWVLGNAFAKWHHQLRVRGMILHSVMLWKTTSEPDTCTQESKGKVVSSPSAKSQFGKWLKKPFFTLMSQRLIAWWEQDCFTKEILLASWHPWKKWSAMFFCDVIYDWLDRRIIIAFPTTWIFKTFIFKFAQRNSNIWEICGCRTKSRESWLGPKSLFSLTLRLEVCSMSGNYFKTVIQYSGWAIFGVCPR